MPVDLHLHSTASDGVLNPAQMIDQAADTGLGCVALTDHNTVRGLAEAEAQAARRSIRFIRGIEMTTLLEGRELHLLGYFIDPAHADLAARGKRHRQRAVERLQAMLERLNGLGIDVAMEQVLETAGDSAPGRPHLGRVLVARGYAQNVLETFERWLGNAGSVYVPVLCEPPAEIYALISKVGGVGGVAHPGASGRANALTESDLRRHREWGAEILEVYHPGHDPATTGRYLSLSRKLGLAPTGGSDWHAPSPAGPFGGTFKSCPDWVESALRQRHARVRAKRMAARGGIEPPI